eukprot:scaffold11175_cov19-Tisochrysis_lutea.AAC.1
MNSALSSFDEKAMWLYLCHPPRVAVILLSVQGAGHALVHGREGILWGRFLRPLKFNSRPWLAKSMQFHVYAASSCVMDALTSVYICRYMSLIGPAVGRRSGQDEGQWSRSH